MDAMKQEAPSHEAVISGVERELQEAAREVSSRGSPGTNLADGTIAPLVDRVSAMSIDEIEKLIGELQAARSYLQSEGEQLRRELSRYEHLNKTAFSSVKVIAQSLGEWRQAGHQLRGRAAV